MARIQHTLAHLLNLREGEGTLVGSVLLHTILLYTANMFARTSAYTLFVNSYGAESLPYIYLGIGIVGSAVSYLYLRLGDHLPLRTLLLGNLVSVLISFLLVWIGLASSLSSTVIFILPIWFGVIYALNMTGFWSLVGRMFTLRQGKRLFGLLGAGEHIAMTMAGFAAPILILWLGTANLLWVGVAAMVAAILVFLYLSTSFAQRLIEPEQRVYSGKGKQTPVSKRYTTLIIAIFGLYIIGAYFVDNIFYDLADWRFPDEDALGAFIGVFFGLVGALSLIMQLFLSGRLLERFGVRAILLTTPIATFIGMALLLAHGTYFGVGMALFWLASFTNLFRLIMDATDNAAVNVLYQPLPTLQRTRTQNLVNGIVYPASIGLTGVLLILLRNQFQLNVIQLAFAALLVSLLWMVTAWLLGEEYPGMVMKALAARMLGSGLFPGLDAQSIRILKSELHSPHPEAVIYALDKLAENAPESLATIVPEMLVHSSPIVRDAALHHIAVLHLTATVPTIRELISMETDAHIMGSALVTLARLDPEQALPLLRSYRHSDNRRIRQSALVGLYRSDIPEAASEADAILQALAGSNQPLDRMMVAAVLGESHRSDGAHILKPLLHDPDRDVQRLALRAAGRMRSPELMPAMVSALGDAAIAGAATSALKAVGTSAVPVLVEADDDHTNPALKHRLLRACGRIGGQEAIDHLLRRLRTTNNRQRETILSSLQQADFIAGSEHQALMDEQIDLEFGIAAWLLAAYLDIEASTEIEPAVYQLLLSALDQEYLHCRLRLLTLLSFLYDAERIHQIQQNLAHASAERRSFGLEALDIMLPVALMKRVAMVLGSRTGAERLAGLQRFYPQTRVPALGRVAELAQISDGRIQPWTKACAIYTLANATTATTEVAIIEAARHAPEPLVSDTARHVLATGISGETAGDRKDQIALSILQKVIILKSVTIFRQTPNNVLADVAALLEEMQVTAGETVITQGEIGDSMYIIVSGEMLVHVGDHALAHIYERDVFGEMALLASEPRSASVTALTDALLLRLEQEPLYELMEGRSEVARGIITLLSHRIQAANRALREAHISPS